jgi:hypothetical protein
MNPDITVGIFIGYLLGLGVAVFYYERIKQS